VKIDNDRKVVVEHEYGSNCDLDDVAEDLPHSSPRYANNFHLSIFLLLSYYLCSFIFYQFEFKRDDGRVQYPLVQIVYSPPCATQLNMLYASTQSNLTKMFSISKVRYIFIFFLRCLPTSLPTASCR
jgi:hypothetical protein